MMSTAGLLLSLVGLEFALAVLAVVGGGARSAARVIYGATGVLSLVMLSLALTHLVASPDTPSTLSLPLGLPWLGTHVRLDALSAFFVAVAALGGAAASLYGLAYSRHEEEPRRVLPFFPAFLGAMTLVLLADDAFTFLIAWETMSLASWALVLAHHRDPESARAATIYIVMASFGTLALLLAFGLLAGPDGGYGFASMREAEHATLTVALVLALLLLGAGSKAGLVPLHVWLPLAHPAAPSHVSALMSGVMTKVAVYGFVRVVFDLIGDPPWWAGIALLVLGALSAVVGILHALMERDLKRVLAYSTIENIGVVFVGLGLALSFQANGMGWAAALALTAALLHVFNHSVFKSLLFFGAGAVAVATGERDMERLGGLIHRMPATSALFLAGSVAISALPPFNGFASEWLVFQAILQSPALPQWSLKILVPAVGGLLALSAALAAACFVRAFGISFLGRPRSDAAAHAGEVEGSMIWAMGVLAALCLLVGVLPGLVLDRLAPIMQALIGARMPTQGDNPWLTLVPIAEASSSYNGLLVFAFIAVSASLAAFAIHRFASHALRRGPAWGCGFADPAPLGQYSADSFAEPIRRVFGPALMRVSVEVDMPRPGELRPARFASTVHDLAWDWIYQPIQNGVARAADRLNRLQFLTIRKYLTLVFASLVSLLVVLALWS